MKHIIIKNSLIATLIFFFSSCCETVYSPYYVIVHTDKNTKYEIIYETDNKKGEKQINTSGLYAKQIDYGRDLCKEDYTPHVKIIRKSGNGLIQVYASEIGGIQMDSNTIRLFNLSECNIDNCGISIDSIFTYLKSVNHKSYMELAPSETTKTIAVEYH